MHKAVIFYTDGTSHKLTLPLSVSLDRFTAIIDSNVVGYPDKTVDHIAQWMER